jgi:hypothetical protein
MLHEEKSGNPAFHKKLNPFLQLENTVLQKSLNAKFDLFLLLTVS